MRHGSAPRDSLLDAITHVQSLHAADEQFTTIFEHLLEVLLEATDSEYGFIGQVLHQPDGQPYLRTYAITNIAWDRATREFYDREAPSGMQFFNLQTLFGAVMVEQRVVIANEPANDERRGGLPPGHPPLNTFLGIPLFRADQMVGMAGLANRPGGYDQALVDHLEPLAVTCANTIALHRTEQARKEADEQLREAVARERAIRDSALDAVITIDTRGTIRSVNPATERVFGYQPGELLDRNVSILMPEQYAREHDAYLQRYLHTGQRRIIGTVREVRGRRKDGTIFPLELSISEVEGADPVSFTGVCRDISARKQTELRMEATLADLERSHGDYQAILNQLRVGVIILDYEQRLSFVSDQCGGLVPALRESSVGERWEDRLPLDAAARDKFRSLLHSGEYGRMNAEWSRTDGGPVRVEFEVRVDPRDATGRIIYLYDVTELHQLRGHASAKSFERLVGHSTAVKRLHREIEEVASGDWPVLIEGETGVGKELVARAIHASSGRRRGPFVAVNGAGLSESQLTSQLFGHRKGAFTGATANQQGLFDAALEGTLFLDDIGDIPPATQLALLRALQEKEIIPLGQSQPRAVDVRIIAATNADLTARVADGRFRDDLLYRVRVGRIAIPPLRERSEDIPLLCDLFLAEARLGQGRRITSITPKAQERLMRHSWPGNVRELKAAIDFATIHCHTATIDVADLPAEIRDTSRVVPPPSVSRNIGNDDIVRALARTGGNRKEAAKLLGISRATFYRRLKTMQQAS